MIAQVGQDNGTQTPKPAAQPGRTGETRYVARQPILDLYGQVHVYDLLFRNSAEELFRRDYDVAVETMLDNEVLFGLERLTNHLPAFVSCTTEALTDCLVLVLSPSLTILGVPAAEEPSPKLVEACRLLKARGFRLALEDFAWHEGLIPLMELADYIRLDFRRFDSEMQQHLAQHGLSSIALIAQKVETREDYDHARELGFAYFQGDYFCRPVLLSKRKVPANRMFHFDIVRELYHDPIDIRKISELIRRDASLTYRLLRLANSPISGVYQEVRSVDMAIVMLGEIALRRIVSLALVSEMNADQPPEILHMALIRARFCELAAHLNKQNPSEQYLLGMMSLLPVMLGVHMKEIVASLPLRSQICDALNGSANSERNLLAWLEFHERGDWQSCDRVAAEMGGSSNQLALFYEEALIWAGAASPAA